MNNNILTRPNADISFYIFRLFIDNLNHEPIKNIIIFILYGSHIQIKIIGIVANEEIMKFNIQKKMLKIGF